MEGVCQERLAFGFGEQGVPFMEELRLQLNYDERQLKQECKPNFLCYTEIIVEIYAVGKRGMNIESR